MEKISYIMTKGKSVIYNDMQIIKPGERHIIKEMTNSIQKLIEQGKLIYKEINYDIRRLKKITNN